MYGDHIKWLIETVITGAVPNLILDENGLVRSDGRNMPVSWMSATIYGKPIIPRTGYLVEFNALWYNAICFAISMYENDPAQQEYTENLRAIASKTKNAFIETFLNDHGYLYDYVDGAYKDLQVRPNMAIAIGMEFSPLDRRQRKRVLDLVTRELLTPKGLRSLSPKSQGYIPSYEGGPVEREYAVHRGPARPWLFGFYADAYFKVFGYSGIGFIERMLIGYEDEMSEGCIGSLSEMYDANPPFTGRGAVSTAKNVGEILRILRTVKEMNKEQQQSVTK